MTDFININFKLMLRVTSIIIIIYIISNSDMISDLNEFVTNQREISEQKHYTKEINSWTNKMEEQNTKKVELQEKINSCKLGEDYMCLTEKSKDNQINKINEDINDVDEKIKILEENKPIKLGGE